MARTFSRMLSLGTVAPAFRLLDTVSRKPLSLAEITLNRPFVLMFICNHCPFVIHLHKGIQQIVGDYEVKGVQFIAISSNDVVNYPADAPNLMTNLFKDLGLNFPYLYDASQEVAKAYQATCTPDFYFFNKNKELVYRGEFDESRPGNLVEVTGNSIRMAIDSLIEEKEVDGNQRPSLGCGIKWK